MSDSMHRIRVAENLYLRNDWTDTMYKRILTSKLGVSGKYVYSDNDFIFMGEIVEAITGLRVSEENENEGLDIALHGEEAYNLEA